MSPHIAILDPSAFTVPYDDHLCRALSGTGARVSLWMRPARRVDYFDGDDRQLRAYETVEHFYRMTERSEWLARRARLKRGLKAGEHVWNMAGLCQRLRPLRPQAIHFQWSVLPAVDRRFLNRLRRIAPCLLTVHDANAFLAPSSRLQSIRQLVSTPVPMTQSTSTARARRACSKARAKLVHTRLRVQGEDQVY